MESGSKKYGLIVPKKRLDGIMKTTNVFGDDSDSENERKHKPVETNNQTKAQQRSAKMVVDKALKEDDSIFKYDEIYDDLKEKKEHSDGNKKKEVEKKPRYIQHLIVQAEKRKIEYERRNERLIQKEREQEGDEFKDKEAFLTSSYKKKLEEMKKLDEEDLKLSMIEDINDVTKRNDMGSFYRHLYKAETCSENADEIKKPLKKSDASRQYRKRASSNSSNDNADNDRDTDISDDDSASSVDSSKRKKTSEEIKEKSPEKLEEKENVSNEPNLMEITKETPKDEKSKKKKNKPKEIKPKINIWEKRTVGDIYDAARQRYFERKMKQSNLHVQS